MKKIEAATTHTTVAFHSFWSHMSCLACFLVHKVNLPTYFAKCGWYCIFLSTFASWQSDLSEAFVPTSLRYSSHQRRRDRLLAYVRLWHACSQQLTSSTQICTHARMHTRSFPTYAVDESLRSRTKLIEHVLQD